MHSTPTLLCRDKKKTDGVETVCKLRLNLERLKFIWK